MKGSHDIQGNAEVANGLTAVLIGEESTGSEAMEAAPSGESMLRKLDRLVFNPLSIGARVAGGPWMMHQNYQEAGPMAMVPPIMMSFLNFMSAAADVLPADKKGASDRLKGQIIPAFAIATVFLMLGQQLAAEKKDPLILGSLGAFVLPAFAQIVAGEELKQKLGMIYLLISKALVMGAMVGFYLGTKLDGVLPLLSDEVYQTGRATALATRAEKTETVDSALGLGSNMHGSFAGPRTPSRRESVVDVAPAPAPTAAPTDGSNERTSLLGAATPAVALH